MLLRSRLAAALTLVFTLAAGASAEGVRLPDIGSSAGAVLSPTEEHDYGASMLHELRGMNLVLDDPLLNDYINDLGYRLVAHSDKTERSFTFFIVNDREINAFATPGGFVAVNAGLITIADNESELAGVMSHEIAHITQQHMLRAFEQAQKATLPIALAMLGALIASRGASGDAAEAVMATGTSLMQQTQINFTRQDEAEADRVGIQTLARAGFDPDAMGDFFARMDRALRPGNDDSNYPSLLRTHPVNTSRISDARSRAAVIKQQQGNSAASVKATTCGYDVCDESYYNSTGTQKDTAPAAAKVAPNASALIASLKDKTPELQTAAPAAPTPAQLRERWLMMRERVRVLSADNKTSIVSYYTDSFRTKPDFDKPANHYGYALALIQDRQPDKALQQLQPLLKAHPDDLALNLAQARADLDAGRRGKALGQYAELSRHSPENRPITLAYAEALLVSGDKADARRAQDLLRPMMAETDDNPDVYLVFGRACELAGETVRAGMAHADAAYLSGRAMDALTQLQTLAKRQDLDYYQRSRIESRINEFTPVVLELRHRGVKPGNEDKRLSARPSGSVHACASGGSPTTSLRPRIAQPAYNQPASNQADPTQSDSCDSLSWRRNKTDVE